MFFVDSGTSNGENGLDGDLKNAARLWLSRDKPVAGTIGLLSLAKGDYARLQSALYNAGYYGGGISITIDGQEASGLAPDVALSERPQVAISVMQGPLYTFGAISIEQEAPAPIHDDDIVKSVREADLRPGETAKAGAVRQARTLLVEAWRQQGHAKAAIATQRVIANHPARVVNVVLALSPGPLTPVGPISVNGTKDLDPAFLLRQTGLHQGQEYDPDDLRRARKRVDRLDVLSIFKIEDGELDDAGDLPLSLTASERKKRRIGFGATVSNVDGAGLNAFWLHRNLFGKAERLRLDGEISGLGQTTDVTELDYRLGGLFTRPGTFLPDIDFNARFLGKREFNDTFEETSIEVASGYTYFRSDRLTLALEAAGKSGRYIDDLGERSLVTLGFDGSVIYDRRDNELEPTKGFYLAGATNPFYELEFGNPGLRLDLEGRTYVSFGEKDRFTLAGRARLGSLIGPPRAETASDILFFTGGGGSVRGYGFKTIGVEEANGDVTGGRSLAEVSLEARFRITPSFGGVVFADAGTVGEDSLVDLASDISVGVGIGVRYFTGIGAIRLDVGVPLNGGPDDPPVAVYAGIGQSF